MKYYFSGITICLAFFLVNCSDLGDPVSSDPPLVMINYFDDIIQPIFNQNCTDIGCHSGAFPPADLNLTPLESYNGLINFESVLYPPDIRIVPGDAANSLLWNKITGNPLFGPQMPLGGMLTADDISRIEDWINMGAPLITEGD